LLAKRRRPQTPDVRGDRRCPSSFWWLVFLGAVSWLIYWKIPRLMSTPEPEDSANGPTGVDRGVSGEGALTTGDQVRRARADGYSSEQFHCGPSYDQWTNLDMTISTHPSVLFVYFTYNGPKRTKVCRNDGGGHGEAVVCDVSSGGRSNSPTLGTRKRFEHFPMKHPFSRGVWDDPSGVEATAGDHWHSRRRKARATTTSFLVGAPTWWLSTSVPMRLIPGVARSTSDLEGEKQFAAAVPCRRYWKHNIKTVRRLGTKGGPAIM